MLLTLFSPSQPGLSKVRLTVTVDNYTVILEVPSGGFAQGNVPLKPGKVQNIKVAVQFNGANVSNGRAENVPSDASLHVQVVRKAPSSGRPHAIGHFIHAAGTPPLEIGCDNPSGPKVTCPGSITCDDLTLTC
jgi:hypothetical protein